MSGGFLCAQEFPSSGRFNVWTLMDGASVADGKFIECLLASEADVSYYGCVLCTKLLIREK